MEEPDEKIGRVLTEEEMGGIVEEIRKLKLVKDRTYKLKKYPRCFIGSEVVFYLMSTPYADSIQEAENVGQQLMDADLFHHVLDAHSFKNGNFYYRFREDEEDKGTGPSVAKVTKEGTVTAEGYLDLKGTIFWNKRYLVLRADEMQIYCFINHLASSPVNIIDLSQAELEVAECSCKTGSYCFTIAGKKRIHVLCADHSKDQLAWLQALTDIGVKFKEEIIDNAGNSIFDFSSNDIDGNLVPLNNFAGKVCLVVNVASY